MRRRFVAILAISVFPASLRADENGVIQDISQKVSNAIASAVREGTPRDRIWVDQNVVSPVRNYVQSLARELDADNLIMPVDPAVLRIAERPVEWAENQILVLKTASLGSAKKSVIVADDSLDIGSAEDCIIVCPGAINVTWSIRNIIVSGQHVKISHSWVEAPPKSHPKEFFRVPRRAPRSLVVCGGTVDMGAAFGTICLAGRRLRIRSSVGSTIVNTRHREVGKIFSVTIEDLQSVQRPWAPEFKMPEGVSVSRFAPNKRPDQSTFAVTFETEEVILHPGDEFPESVTKRHSDLRGWKVCSILDGFVLFKRNEELHGYTQLVPWKSSDSIAESQSPPH